MNRDGSPSIEQIIESLPTDRVLALLIQELLELRAEIEVTQQLLLEQVVAGKDKAEKQFVETRLRQRRLSTVSAILGEWRARAELELGDGPNPTK